MSFSSLTASPPGVVHSGLLASRAAHHGEKRDPRKLPVPDTSLDAPFVHCLAGYSRRIAVQYTRAPGESGIAARTPLPVRYQRRTVQSGTSTSAKDTDQSHPRCVTIGSE